VLFVGDAAALEAGAYGPLLGVTGVVVGLFVLLGLVQFLLLARAVDRTAEAVTRAAADVETGAAAVAEAAETVETGAEEVETAAADVETAAKDVEAVADEVGAAAEGTGAPADPPKQANETGEQAERTAGAAQKQGEQAKDAASEAKATGEQAGDVAGEAKERLGEPRDADDPDTNDSDGNAEADDADASRWSCRRVRIYGRARPRAAMRRFRVGSALGIPIQIDLTFLLVLPLFAWLIGTGIERIVPVLNRLPAAAVDPAPLVGSPTRWLLGLAAAVGLFVGVVLHELGHSLVAKSYGYPIESITLWLFGGIARLAELPEHWREELAIALAGPAVSVALGVAFYAPFVALPGDAHAARFVVGYLAVLNVALAAFNMVPAFPMDGGRVLRAVLGLRYPYARATQLAAEVGKLFAILFGLAGLVGGNIILIGLAFFVYIGAAGEAQQVTIDAAFEGVAVADIMTPADELDVVAPGDSVAELMERMFRERHTGYPVLEGGRPVGMVTLGDAEDVGAVEREAYTVADVMSDDLVTVGPDAPVTDALELMREHDVGRLLVLDGEDVAGLLSRTDVMHALDVVKSAGHDLPERLGERS